MLKTLMGFHLPKFCRLGFFLPSWHIGHLPYLNYVPPFLVNAQICQRVFGFFCSEVFVRGEAKMAEKNIDTKSFLVYNKTV
jgi:hypothetical protein